MTTGPLGFAQPDFAAFALAALLKTLPRDAADGYRKSAVLAEATVAEDRTDISWVSVEEPDRVGDIVLASGLDDSHFRLNPVVTLNHDYAAAPVGLALWWRPVTQGERRGVVARTHYPPPPPNHAGRWRPDECLAHVRAGLLRGKSVGFLPLRARPPTPEEAKAGARRVIERWLLLEYAVCALPVQPLALVAQASVGA